MRRLTQVPVNRYVFLVLRVPLRTLARKVSLLPTSHRRSLVPGLALCLLLVGCKDAPTVPASLQQLAGGQEWVAIHAPRDLPTAQTWAAYIDRQTDSGRAALLRVQELSRRGSEARSHGDLAAAAALEREAERIAIASLSRYPEPAKLQRSLLAVDAWRGLVQADVALERSPELTEALHRVDSARNRSAALLAQGDTTGAVLLLAEASDQIRAFTPTAVALRVLEKVEQRLLTSENRSSAVERALRLLSASRQELLSGDPHRALRRALYALQLADGAEIPARAEAECLEPGC